MNLLDYIHNNCKNNKNYDSRIFLNSNNILKNFSIYDSFQPNKDIVYEVIREAVTNNIIGYNMLNIDSLTKHIDFGDNIYYQFKDSKHEKIIFDTQLLIIQNPQKRRKFIINEILS